MKCPVCKELIQEESMSFCIHCGCDLRLFSSKVPDNGALHDRQLETAQNNCQGQTKTKDVELNRKKDFFEIKNRIKKIKVSQNEYRQLLKIYSKVNEELEKELKLQNQKIKKVDDRLSNMIKESNAKFQTINNELQKMDN